MPLSGDLCSRPLIKKIWRDFTRVTGLLPTKRAKSRGWRDDPNSTGEIAGHHPTLCDRLEKSPWSVRISSTPTDTEAGLDGLLRTPHLACVYEHGGAAAPGSYICYDIVFILDCGSATMEFKRYGGTGHGICLQQRQQYVKSPDARVDLPCLALHISCPH